MTSPRLRCRYSPPPTLRRLVRQMFGNGLWVGRRPRAHGLRHLAPAVFLSAILLMGGIAVVQGGGVWGWLVGGVGVLYLLAVVGATLAWLGKAGLGAFWLPLVFVNAHVAYAIGTFNGLISPGYPGG